jgi:polyisoprenoid-binding protein YceI
MIFIKRYLTRTTVFNTLGFAGLLVYCGLASALQFSQVQVNESSVNFGFRQMGVASEGRFNRFNAQLVFDPAKLSQAKATFEIYVDSIDTGSKEGDDEVVGKLWFNAKMFPVASFVSTGIKALGGNSYVASGKLSIKGKTLAVTTPVTFLSEGKRGIFDGAFVINRLDYAIGEGLWADVGTVANAIQIKFHIVVNVSPAKK